jgi:hypothetical protein
VAPEGADRIGEFWGNPKTRTFAELLIDCEEDGTLRAVLVGMLRETARSKRSIGEPYRERRVPPNRWSRL